MSQSQRLDSEAKSQKPPAFVCRFGLGKGGGKGGWGGGGGVREGGGVCLITTSHLAFMVACNPISNCMEHLQAQSAASWIQKLFINPPTLAKFALPSASIMTLPSVPTCFAQASITKASFTEIQAIVSTPLPLNSSAFSTKPGRCLVLHVGVKAPGTAKMMTCAP